MVVSGIPGKQGLEGGTGGMLFSCSLTQGALQDFILYFMLFNIYNA